MSFNKFPNIIFGICDVCGGQGGDYPSPGAANAVARDTTGNGLVLEWYQEKLVCNVCKTTLKSDAESLLNAGKHAKEEVFRAKAGFRNSV
jgi:hypothetical protein